VAACRYVLPRTQFNFLLYSLKQNPVYDVCRGNEKLQFIPASSELLFTPASVEVVVDSG